MWFECKTLEEYPEYVKFYGAAWTRTILLFWKLNKKFGFIWILKKCDFQTYFTETIQSRAVHLERSTNFIYVHVLMKSQFNNGIPCYALLSLNIPSMCLINKRILGIELLVKFRFESRMKSWERFSSVFFIGIQRIYYWMKLLPHCLEAWSFPIFEQFANF